MLIFLFNFYIFTFYIYMQNFNGINACRNHSEQILHTQTMNEKLYFSHIFIVNVIETRAPTMQSSMFLMQKLLAIKIKSIDEWLITSLQKIKNFKKMQKFIELIVFDSVNKIWTPDHSFLLIAIFQKFFYSWMNFFENTLRWFVMATNYLLDHPIFLLLDFQHTRNKFWRFIKKFILVDVIHAHFPIAFLNSF